jgi:hypothetical protein
MGSRPDVSPIMKVRASCRARNGPTGQADRCGAFQRGDPSEPTRVDRLIYGPKLSQVCVGPDNAHILPCPLMATPGPPASGRKGTPKPLPAPNPRLTSLSPPQAAPLYAVQAVVAAAKSCRILLANSHVPASLSSTAATVRRPDARVRC